MCAGVDGHSAGDEEPFQEHIASQSVSGHHWSAGTAQHEHRRLEHPRLSYSSEVGAYRSCNRVVEGRQLLNARQRAQGVAAAIE
jgi:hypothetical protein